MRIIIKYFGYTLNIINKERRQKHFGGGGGDDGKTIAKNSTIKPLSTLSVPCMKIQGDAMAAHDHN